jgi:hypothetical protein
MFSHLGSAVIEYVAFGAGSTIFSGIPHLLGDAKLSP